MSRIADRPLYRTFCSRQASQKLRYTPGLERKKVEIEDGPGPGGSGLLRSLIQLGNGPALPF
jgi:hypothetical protein